MQLRQFGKPRRLNRAVNAIEPDRDQMAQGHERVRHRATRRLGAFEDRFAGRFVDQHDARTRRNLSFEPIPDSVRKARDHFMSISVPVIVPHDSAVRCSLRDAFGGYSSIGHMRFLNLQMRPSDLFDDA
jgi:hypothetical protein